MPKLISKQPSHLAYLSAVIRGYFNAAYDFPPQDMREAAENLWKKEEVKEAMLIVYETALKGTFPRKGIKPASPKIMIIATLLECSKYAIQKTIKNDISRSPVEIKKLARMTRNLKIQIEHFLKSFGSKEDAIVYRLAKRIDPFFPPYFPPSELDPTVIRDEIIIEGLHMLASALNSWREIVMTERLGYSNEFSGIVFPYPKGKGKRKDYREYSLTYGLWRIFNTNLHRPLSPVIATLRNATFPDKPPITARRVREMIKEMLKGKTAEIIPTVGFLA